MKDTILDRVTNGVAATGISAPVWLPPLREMSEVAALILPILGVLWLLVQIVTKLTRR